MQRLMAILLVTLGGWLGVLGDALAATRVQVLATDPPGDVVTLGRSQSFYLRMAYISDQPVRIWARPFFQGKEVNAGSNPSRIHAAGSGEALGWFFLMQSGEQVDEIRIRAGGGSTRGTRVVASYPVRIRASDQAAADRTEPTWVAEMKRQDAVAQRAAYEGRMNTLPSMRGTALLSGFMLLMAGIGMFGCVGPAWALWRWRGVWRIAAALPAALMTFVVLRLVIDTARDPTSHNLWPFEILQAGALSVVVMVLLWVARKLGGTRR